jgi:hypothetical protein
MKANLHGHWEGTIIYGPGYGENENKELYFNIDIVQTKDTFTGTAVDTRGVGVNPDNALIKGFVEDNEVSFVKQYASTLWFDENNTEILLKDKPSPEINYWGTFDSVTNSIKGNWEIIITGKETEEGWLVDIATGTFTMRRS